MAKRKFAGISAEIEKARHTDTETNGRSTTPGKSTNPRWKQHTVMLEKDVHADAADLLRRRDDGTDMSDLLNRLLADWVREERTRM